MPITIAMDLPTRLRHTCRPPLGVENVEEFVLWVSRGSGIGISGIGE